MVTQERYFTAEEFWDYCQLPENRNRRLELVEGEIREMTPAGGEHGEVAGGFFGFIWNFAREKGLGRVTAAETGFILYKNPNPDGKDTVRAPDVGFVSIERARDPLPAQFVPIVPDLVVEVVSPTDRAEDIEEKINLYLKYGVRLIWVAYSVTKTIVVHTPTSIKRLTIGDTLDGGDVLPGFKLKISEIFPK
jgi:Uma2 family endonuclease